MAEESGPFLDPEDQNAPLVFGAPVPQPAQPQPRPRRRQTYGVYMPFNDGSELINNASAMANNYAGGHFGHMAGMVNQVNNAWQKENDSRVAQAREMRRMQHERAMMQMQAEIARKDREGEMVRQIIASM
jgi:hypothetical protein